TMIETSNQAIYFYLVLLLILISVNADNEIRLLENLRSAYPDWKPRGIVDVGANVGGWTRELREVFFGEGSSGKDYAVLCHPDAKAVTNEIPRIDVNDELALREVFFGEGSSGKDYAVLCHPDAKAVTNEIPRIDVNDELALREVFFGEGSSGKDYAVLCHPDAKAGSVALPVSSVFQDSRDDGSAPVDYVLMDCDHVLPESGKSIYDKFNLNRKKRPTVFVSGRSGPPRQVPEKHLKTGGMLTKLLKQMLEPHAAKIERTKELKEKCLNKDVCGLLLKGGKPEPYVKHAMANLLGKYPNVQFASIDSTVLFLTNLEEYLPEYVAGEHRFVVFKKVSGGLAAGDNETKAEGRLKTSILPLEETGVSFGTMNTLVSGVLNGKKMRNIPALPYIKTRTKKLEESERLKRDRKKDQARQKSSIVPLDSVLTLGLGLGRSVGRSVGRVCYPGVKTFMVEAFPAHSGSLEETKKAFGDGVVDYAIAVLSSKDGDTVKFHSIKNGFSTGNSMFIEQSEHYNNNNNAKFDLVNTTKLDTLLEHKMEHVDYLKLDVQGAELMVLLGATETLKKATFVQFEVSVIEYNKGGACWHEVDELLRKNGFFFYDQSDNIVAEEVFHTKATGQFDALYIKPSSHNMPSWLVDNKAVFCGSNQEGIGESRIKEGKNIRVDVLDVATSGNDESHLANLSHLLCPDFLCCIICVCGGIFGWEKIEG
ncbi:hypothetical protein ACHAXA_007187, partial [Cyclostephanos tholiformis]